MSIHFMQSIDTFCITDPSFSNLLNVMTPTNLNNHSFDLNQTIENHPALNCLSKHQIKKLFINKMNDTDGQDNSIKKNKFFLEIKEGCCSLSDKAVETYEKIKSQVQIKLYQLLLQYTKIEKWLHKIDQCETMNGPFSSTLSEQPFNEGFTFDSLVAICPQYPMIMNSNFDNILKFNFDDLLGDENDVVQIKSALPNKLSNRDPNCMKALKCYFEKNIFKEKSVQYTTTPAFIDQQLEAYPECAQQLQKAHQQRCSAQQTSQRKKLRKIRSQNKTIDFEVKFLETEIKLNHTEEALKNAQRLLGLYNKGFENLTKNKSEA